MATSKPTTPPTEDQLFDAAVTNLSGADSELAPEKLGTTVIAKAAKKPSDNGEK